MDCFLLRKTCGMGRLRQGKTMIKARASQTTHNTTQHSMRSTYRLLHQSIEDTGLENFRLRFDSLTQNWFVVVLTANREGRWNEETYQIPDWIVTNRLEEASGPISLSSLLSHALAS